MNVSIDIAALDNGETRYVHTNGNVLEMSGEVEGGEWFAYNDNEDCFAQGYYERNGDCDIMQDEDGNELARISGTDAMLKWAEQQLA